jgi:pseudouridylate synthase / pseudouridine kinase
VQHEIPQAEIEIVIEEAVRECNRLGIIGKDITPFLLQYVTEATKGRSLDANIALIKDNARVGAEIAVALASLDDPTYFEVTETSATPPRSPVPSAADEGVDIMVIGSMAVDLTSTLPTVSSESMQLHTSQPAGMHTSAGGVAHNVALAAFYTSSKPVRLVTAVGSDPDGAWLCKHARTVGLDVAFTSGERETARYVAIHDKNGDLVTATADMRIIERFKVEDIQKEVRRGKPKFLAFDGNISPTMVNTILRESEPWTTGIP